MMCNRSESHGHAEKNMSVSIYHEFEDRIDQLSVVEKKLLLERLNRDLRAYEVEEFMTGLAEMAADPDIQNEIREIDREFAEAEQDGLENL